MEAQSRQRLEPAAVARLSTTLAVGHGHVALIANHPDQALAVAEQAVQHVGAYSVLRIRACVDEPLEDAHRELGFDLAPPPSDYERQRALEAHVENARAAGLPVIAMVLDADVATAEGLERARTSLECVPHAIECVRIVLPGARSLASTLCQPAARALASRIGTRIEIPPEAFEPVTMQAGIFADRHAAHALRRTLAEKIRDVRVTKLDGSRGGVMPDAYSVRVVGLRTHVEIEHAENAIRHLGHDPVRIAAESLRRHHRPGGVRHVLWTRLFGR